MLESMSVKFKREPRSTVCVEFDECDDDSGSIKYSSTTALLACQDMDGGSLRTRRIQSQHSTLLGKDDRHGDERRESDCQLVIDLPQVTGERLH